MYGGPLKIVVYHVKFLSDRYFMTTAEDPISVNCLWRPEPLCIAIIFQRHKSWVQEETFGIYSYSTSSEQSVPVWDVFGGARVM